MQHAERLLVRDDEQPVGLASPEASLATNLVDATPTEQVTPCSSATRSRICAAICAGEPSRRIEPETSRNASSSDSGSTSGVTSLNRPSPRATPPQYRSKSGSSTTACGQARRARAIGIAACTPKVRAS
jgi:hypothetical protein